MFDLSIGSRLLASMHARLDLDLSYAVINLTPALSDVYGKVFQLYEMGITLTINNISLYKGDDAGIR